MSTPYANSFCFEGTSVERKNMGSYQLTGLHPLSKNKTKVSFKVIRYGGDAPICFGIITASRKKEQYSGDFGDH